MVDSPEMMCALIIDGFAAVIGLGLTLGTTAGGRLPGERKGELGRGELGLEAVLLVCKSFVDELSCTLCLLGCSVL